LPYQSKSQAAFFNIHKKELERKGVNVDEWNAASKGQHDLPEHVHKSAPYHMARKARKDGE
jgi:hypothetical protein